MRKHPLPDFSQCPATGWELKNGSLVYGRWIGNGEVDLAFHFRREAVPKDLLRVLWCCAYTGTPVVLNQGMCSYSPAHNLRFRNKEHMWMVWPSFCHAGRLSIDDSDLLWIGTSNRAIRVEPGTILAVRTSRTTGYQTLYEAPEYKKPVIRLLDDPKRDGCFVAYYDGATLAEGRTKKFAENLAAKLGGTVIDRTKRGLAAMSVKLPARTLRLRGTDAATG